MAHRINRLALSFASLVLFSSSLLFQSSAAAAEDWPQFRGPTGQGHSTEVGLPLEWSDTKNVIWKTPVPGTGWSSPVVSNGRVWVTSTNVPIGNSNHTADTSLRVLAFDVETGRQIVDKEVFRIRNPGSISPKNSRASPTAIVEGDRVYVHFGTDGTAALTTTGELVWKTQFEYESQHGNGGSPVLYGDLLIFSCDGDDSAFVIALDKDTGKVRWKTARRRPYDQAYSTPLVIRVEDKDQLVSVGAYRTAAYDPKNGEEIWRASYPARFPDGFSNVMRPVYGHGMVFVSAGFNDPWLMAVRVDGKGDVTRTHVAWTLHRNAPLTPSPLLVGDELYIVNDVGIAACLDAVTGRTIWQHRLNGNFSASPVFADGRIYFLSEEGVATVIAPGPEFRALATNEVNGATLASMAVSNGSIFIRSGTHLYRIAQSKAKAGQSEAASPQALFDRAVADFRNGRIRESVDRFDALAKAAPDEAPQLWQRGIALYYVGRYQDCRAQFESHRTVNPADVENAAWHFLCVARSESPSAARAALLPVGRDRRVPLPEIYQMLSGTLTPEQVMAAAGTQPASSAAPLFYAHLYVGLYFDAIGNKAGALEHISAAADSQYAAIGGYMHTVARIHLGSLQTGAR